MPFQRKTFLAAILIVATAIAAWAFLGRSPLPQDLVKLRFAATRFLGEEIPFVAYDKGYFREQGLEVELSYSTAGWQSLKRLFEGEADVATVAELPIVYAALDRKKYTKTPAGDFVIVADLTTNRVQGGVARRDRGIKSLADLRGKTIALPQGTTIDYLVDSVIRRQGIGESEVKLVNIDVARLPQAIVSGEVDAVFGWKPHIALAQEALADNAVELDVAQRYPTAWLIVFMKDYLHKHPDIAVRILRAIAKAEIYSKDYPDESKRILAKHLQIDPAAAEKMSKGVEFRLSLSEALLSLFDEQARWAIRRGFVAEQAPPNFLHYIDQAPLKQVKPEAITIIQ